ncbi:MAG: hypothetical protein F4Y35_03765 [Chloroflexi bacterium]|nr:hypothetical protein [Chloroflexota bacterium]
MDAYTAQVLLKEEVKEARRRRLLSADHFTVDGTLLDVWASPKSIVRATSNFLLPAADATGSATSRASVAAARLTSRPPIRMRGASARARSRRHGSATSVIC